jgi:hypothetical protein
MGELTLRIAAAKLMLFLALVVLVGVPLCAQDSDLTNARVVELSKKGMDDDIIIAKIKNGNCKFSLSDDDLIALKKDGVSAKVVASMLEASAITVTKVTIDQRPVDMHTLGQAKVGGRLGSAFTYGIKSVKSKAYLQGQHSSVIVSPTPEIILELPKGDTIDNYMIVQLDGKDDRRELEVGSSGGIVGAKSGIRAEAIRRTTSTAMGGNKFKMSVDGKLKKGEYIIYIVGSADNIKGIHGKGFDFTVE